MAELNKRESAMVPVYCSLVLKGKKTISEVPAKLRDAVSSWLVDNGHPELAEGDA